MEILSKREAIRQCILLEYPNIDKSLRRTTKINLDVLLDALSKKEYNLAKELGYSAGGLTKLIKRFWPNKPPTSKKLCTYLLAKNSLCFCTKCDNVYSVDNFYLNKDRKVSYCKRCSDELTTPSQSHRTALYRASKLQASPTWANQSKIEEIYANCPKGYHVDHIIPLNGINVCGLHIETNLQYLPAKENCSKGNKFIFQS